MKLHSQESRANAKAFLSGMVVPTLLIALFLASARATFIPAPASAKPEQTSDPSPAVVAEPSKAVPAVAVAAAVPAVVVPGVEKTCVAGSSYGYSDDRDFFWALVEGGDDGKRHTMGSTDRRAQKAIARALRAEDGEFLYFRMDDRDYIVRDPEAIAAANEIVEPMQVLGRKMGELGGRQGALGGRQGVLGGEQGRLGARQAQLAAQQVSLTMQIHSRERRGLSTAQLEREQQEVEEEMNECARRQSQLGRKQSELGEEQSVLGAEQSRYGGQMSRLSAKVEKDLRKLARKSIQSGQATELTEDDA